MRKFSILWLLVISAFLFGCFQTETRVRIKPDGRGVIEETFLLPTPVLDSVQNLAKEINTNDSNTKNEGKPESQDPVQGMIQDARTKAAQYGPNVTFISALPVKTETMGGYKALYAFTDINTVRINQNPENKTEKPGDSKDPSTKKEEIILFRLVKGPVSTLFVTMPEYKKEDKRDQVQKDKDPAKSQTDPQSVEMMKELFKDMRVKVSLEIDGTLLKTNATYR
ncbi:MAG: hypothetical protein C0407_16130, partial [Desulfobacca sp.]|nr:hypothetical protein [Desulfobacca sp.]